MGASPSASSRRLQRLTNQFNGVLFPVIVDSDARTANGAAADRSCCEGTRLSLAIGRADRAAPGHAGRAAGARLGRTQADEIAARIPVMQILAVAVTIRVGNATGTTLLKGAGQHRLRRDGQPRHGSGQPGAQRRC